MFLYPWGDMHSLNLGWFLLQFKDWVEKIQDYLDNGGGTSENLANVIAPVFNAANYYSAGDYVLYNNELYKANQAVNPGTWDPDAWTRCLIVDEMGSGGAGVDNVARLMIAGQYSNTYNYQKYAICRYNDKLWMCNTNIPVGGEEWEPGHWDEITVGAGLTGLRRSVETLAGNITALTNAVNGLDEYIRGKKIAIFGDSLSDEDIQWQPAIKDVWVKSFRTLCAPYGTTITNYSRSSRGFCIKDNNNQYTGVEAIQNADLTNIDTIIIFMGINDFLGGTIFGQPNGNTNNTLWLALDTIANIIKEKNVFVITPMNNTGITAHASVTCDMYRIAIANWAYKNGFMLINGPGIPKFFTGSTYFFDRLHPKNEYTPIIAQYIFQKIVSGGEPFKCNNELADYSIQDTAHATGIRLRFSATLENFTLHFRFTATAQIPADEILLNSIAAQWLFTPCRVNASTFAFSQLRSGGVDEFGGSVTADAAAYYDYPVIVRSLSLGQANL